MMIIMMIIIIIIIIIIFIFYIKHSQCNWLTCTLNHQVIASGWVVELADLL